GVLRGRGHVAMDEIAGGDQLVHVEERRGRGCIRHWGPPRPPEWRAPGGGASVAGRERRPDGRDQSRVVAAAAGARKRGLPPRGAGAFPPRRTPTPGFSSAQSAAGSVPASAGM